LIRLAWVTHCDGNTLDFVTLLGGVACCVSLTWSSCRWVTFDLLTLTYVGGSQGASEGRRTGQPAGLWSVSGQQRVAQRSALHGCRQVRYTFLHCDILCTPWVGKLSCILLFVSSPNTDQIVQGSAVEIWWYMYWPLYCKLSIECAGKKTLKIVCCLSKMERIAVFFGLPCRNCYVPIRILITGKEVNSWYCRKKITLRTRLCTWNAYDKFSLAEQIAFLTQFSQLTQATQRQKHRDKSVVYSCITCIAYVTFFVFVTLLSLHNY